MQSRGRVCWATVDVSVHSVLGCLQVWAWASRAWGCVRSRGLAEGGAWAFEVRAVVRCDAHVRAGRRGLAAGQGWASGAVGLRNF